MTIKRALIIGTLLATTIALITIGLKTGSFDNKDNENYKPKILNKNFTAIRVNAENDITPTSLNWLLNETINLRNRPQITNFNSNILFNGVTNNEYYTFSKEDQLKTRASSENLIYNKSSSNYTYYQGTVYNGSAWYSSNIQNNNQETAIHSPYNTNTARIMRFNTEPTGDVYTWLINNAQPYYNNNVIITNKSPAIHQIRKANVLIQDGAIINTEGTIQVLIDAGYEKCYVNGTKITDFTTPLTITNEDIAIQVQGTNTNTVGYVLTINYNNTLPVIEPTPIPDPTNPIYEVVDIKPLMLQILTMPFTFISQAFNVTLWPGTQYEFNISNFILSIIAIATILFIIRLFTSGFSVIGNYTGARNDRAFKKSQTRLNNAKAKNIENNTPKKTESHVTIKKEK